MLALALLAWVWGRRAYGDRAAFYAALSILTSIGVFLFTRVFIPEVLLAFFLALALYSFLIGLEDNQPARFYVMWAALALAMLAKGLVAPVFFFAAVAPYLLLTGDWRRVAPIQASPTGILLFLAIAAPWHILAGLRNPGEGHPVGNIPTPGNVHGFFYFYFINEHFLRFLGKRYPPDYNKLPGLLYWALHLVWLFPWSLYLPVVLRRAWTTRRRWFNGLRPTRHSVLRRSAALREKTNWLLAIYAAFILLFFSISTNQEYYTYPVYFPLLLLTAGVLASEETESAVASQSLQGAQAAFAVTGIAVAAALAYGLWSSRGIPMWLTPGHAFLRASCGCGLYPVHVALPGPHRSLFRRATLAGGVGGRRTRGRSGPRLGSAHAPATLRGHGQRRLHFRHFPHRGAYCAGPLPAHPLLA